MSKFQLQSKHICFLHLPTILQILCILILAMILIGKYFNSQVLLIRNLRLKDVFGSQLLTDSTGIQTQALLRRTVAMKRGK